MKISYLSQINMRGKVLSSLFGSDDGPNVTVNKEENYSCGERYLVVVDIITLLPQMKDDGLN